VTRPVDLFSPVKGFADLPQFYSCESPAMIPTATAYCPEIVIYNFNTSSVALLELTCILDSEDHLEAARYISKVSWNNSSFWLIWIVWISQTVMKH